MRGLLVAVILAGCGGAREDAAKPSSAPPPPLTTSCEASHNAVGPTCVPRFDDCAPHEVPRLGGGCIAAGVDACAKGTTADGAGGCTATIPKCAAGELAFAGESCAPIAACSDPATSDVHVDAAYSGPSDGTASKPYRTITAAIAAATSGAVIAIAAGEYSEDVVIDKALTLRGRCPSQVTVRGVSSAAAITVRAPATIRSLAITGAGRGIFAEGVNGVTVDSVYVHDTADLGIGGRDREGPLAMTIRRVLVERVAGAGIINTGGTATIDDAVVHDVKSFGTALLGYGILASGSTATKSAGDVRVRRAIVERSAFTGIASIGAKLSIEGAIVRETGAIGIGAGVDAVTPIATTLRVDGAIVEDVSGSGINADSTTSLDVLRSTVRRTTSTGLFARNVGSVTIGSSRVDKAAGRGITLELSRSVVERTIVSGTTLRGEMGCGICSFSTSAHAVELRNVIARDNALGGIGTDGSALTVNGALVQRNRQLGFSLANAVTNLNAVIVRDTLPNGPRGDGLLVSFTPEHEAKLTLTDSEFASNVRTGIALLAPATIERVFIHDTKPNTEGLGAGVIATVPTGRTTPFDVELHSVFVERTSPVGMYLQVVHVTVDACTIRDVKAAATGDFGDGLAVSAAEFSGGGTSFIVPGDVQVKGTLIERSARAGISVFGSNLALAGSRLSCNTLDIDVEESFTDTAKNPNRVLDGGDNDCACGSGAKICQARSNGLRPIAVGE